MPSPKPAIESQERARAVIEDPDATSHERAMAELALKRHTLTRRLAAKPRSGTDCCHERAKRKLSKAAFEAREHLGEAS